MTLRQDLAISTQLLPAFEHGHGTKWTTYQYQDRRHYLSRDAHTSTDFWLPCTNLQVLDVIQCASPIGAPTIWIIDLRVIKIDVDEWSQKRTAVHVKAVRKSEPYTIPQQDEAA